MANKKSSRIITSLVAATATLVAALGLQVLPANAATCVSGGDGDALVPIVICNATDFSALQAATTNHYVLGADINMANITWSNDSSFSGSLDGAGHTVSNLAIAATAATQVDGIFERLSAGSVVKNIRFQNASLYVEDRGYSGFLAYQISGLVDNVIIQGQVWSNTSYTGGFGGQLQGGTITNSISDLDIYLSVDAYVGGFFGVNNGHRTLGLGSVGNSLFTGTINRGYTSPITLEGRPWREPGDYSVFPTCETIVQTYYLSTSASSPEGCGASKTFAELSNASAATEGFSSWSTDKWVFGQGASLPQLKTFAAAPSQQLFPAMNAGAARINLTWLAPLGEYITGFDVQTRTRTTFWSDAQKTSVEDGATITGLTNGTAYWVRVRSVNPNGNSEWNYISSPVVPIDVTTAVNTLKATSKKGVVTVTWALPTSNNGSNVSKFQVGLYKSATATTPYKVVSAGTQLKSTIKGLKLKSNVWIGVQTQNAAGLSPFSTRVKVTIK